MRFKIGDFIVETGKEIEYLNEKIAVPTTISRSDKPENYHFKHKTREFSVFRSLELLEKEDRKYYRVLDDIFDFIDLIELLKAFNSNKLDTSKIYNINDNFEVRTAQKDGNISLEIHFANYSYKLYLDKFECSSLAAKFGKILQRCEVWQESEA
ncbi:MAG: hypothetical protein FAF04_08490 [Epsilonproteobacteria bacterium]|nr:hypothetical protein [Campylobacterota bacterium]